MPIISSTAQSVDVSSKITVSFNSDTYWYTRSSNTGTGSVTCAVSIPAGSTVHSSTFTCSTSGATLYGGATKINGTQVSGGGPHTVANGTATSITVNFSFKSYYDPSDYTGKPTSTTTTTRTFSNCILTVNYTPPYTAPTVTNVTLDADAAAASATTTLRWASADGDYNDISKHQVYRSVNGAAYAWLADTNASTKTLTVAAPATSGQHHRYYIVAVGSYSNSAAAYSPYYYAYTNPTVSGVTLSSSYQPVGGSATLSWTGSNGVANEISKYQVYRSVNGAAYALLAQPTSNSLSVDANATAGQNNRYYIVAVGEYTNSAAVYSGYLYTYSAPTVGNVSLDASATAANGTTYLRWTSADGHYNAITGHEVWRSINGAAYTRISTPSASTKALSVAAPSTAGQYHRFRVLAIGTYTNSALAYSGYLYAYKAPGIPTGAAVSPTSVIQGAAYTFSWTEGTAPVAMTRTKFEVTRAGALISSPTGTSVSLTAPSAVGTHQHAVRAIGSVSGYNSAYTANVALTVTAAPAPTVSNVALSTGYAAVNASVTLSWSSAKGTGNAITKHQVYRSVNGGSYALLAETTAKSVTVTAPATAGQYHRYYVVAIGTYSNSAAVYSGYLRAYRAPGAPTGVSVSPTSVLPSASVRVSWTAGTAGVGVSTTKYEVYIGGSLVGSTATGTTLYLDVAAPSTAGTAVYTVKAIGSPAGYNSAVSSGATLTIQNPASSGSLSATSVEMSGSKTISMTIASASGSYTHKVVWTFGSASSTQNVAAGAQPPAFTVPLAWCAQIPSAEYGKAYARLETYAGAVKAGEKTYEFTVTVPASVIPTIGTFTPTRVQNGVDATITKYVQTYSGVTLTMGSVAGAQGSTISSYKISGGGFIKTASSATFTPLPNSGVITFTAEVQDSRGRKGIKTTSITVEPYSKPTLSGVSAYRCNSGGTASTSGTYVRMIATRALSSIGGQNTATLSGRVYMKGATPPSFTTMTSGTAWVTGAGNILVTKSYIVDIRVVDKLNTTSVQVEIPTDIVGLNVLDAAVGAAIGKYAETAGELQLPESWRIRGNLQVKDVRGTNPTPDAMPDYAVSTFFNDQYGHTWMSGFTVKGFVANYQAWQLAAPSAYYDNERLLFRVGRAAAWGAWREVLTSGNYSSYVTPAGIGAAESGHGHSSLALSAPVPRGRWSGWNIALDITTPSHGAIAWAPETGFGFMLGFHSDNNIYFAKIAQEGTGSYSYIFQGDGNSITGAGGRIFLHSSNYNSYAPTKTGGGASGTWGITASGNLPLSGGTITGPVDIRGSAGSGPLKVRGIDGQDGNGNLGDLYLNLLSNGNIFCRQGTFANLDSGNYTTYVTPANIGAAATSHTHSYLSKSGDTLTGLLQISGQKTINTTTPGLTNYGLHFTGQTTADYATGITWNGGTGSTGAQAGIYVQGSGAYGTKMFFATTNAYVTGAQTAISIDQTGVTNFVRSRPTALGNLILDAGNYNNYSPSKTGTGASGSWGISVTGSSASCTGNAATATTASDSSKLGGLSLGNATAGSHPGANVVVRTDANGYLNVGWINTVSGTATGTPTRIYCSQDAYLRYYAPDNATLRRSMKTYITYGASYPASPQVGDIHLLYV